MDELGITHLFEGVEDKAACLRALQSDLDVGADATMCVGDDVPDLPMLEVAGIAVTVADAATEVAAVADWQTERRGGDGAVREVCDRLITAQRR